jgi:hypothetical protein
MAQLTIQQIFGDSSYIDLTANTLVIHMSDLVNLGLDTPSEINGVPILAAISKQAYIATVNNLDETLNIGVQLSVSSPSVRAGIEKTLYEYAFSFYAPYLTPTLDPDDL